MPEQTVPCRLCSEPTPSTGTKLCDGCWELETRIKRDPVLARKILRKIAYDAKHPPEKVRLEMCVGCEDNFYNGNNELGVKQCWNFPKAQTVMRKKVGINDVPPWKHQPIKVLSCRREKGYVFIEADKEY